MKPIILYTIIFGAVVALCANGGPFLTSTTNQLEDTSQRINSYINGKISFEDLTKDKEDCDALTNYYLSHPGEIPTKAKLPLSRCFALEGAFPEAAQLAQEYLNTYSNDWRGWSILGGSYFLGNSFDKAVQAYKNAVRLGNTNSYAPLAMAALKANRMDVVGELVPQLMKLKNAKQSPEEDRYHLISILLFYSEKTYQKDIFIQTLKDEDLREILRDNDIRLDVTSGCQLFEGKEIDRIRQELKATEAKDSNSITNAPSP